MPITFRRSLGLLGCLAIALLSARNRGPSAQTLGEPEDFTAIAIVNNNLASGAGTVATKIVAHKNVVELENFATQPVMLTEITSKKAKN